MIKLGSNSIGKVYLGTNAISKAYLGGNLVFQSGSGPTPIPYTTVEYIETDGVAYINTNINGTPQKSAEIKVLPVASQNDQTYLGSRGSTTDGEGKKFVFFQCRLLSDALYHLCFGYYYNIAGSSNPDISDSVTNETPFEGRASFKSGTQVCGAKQYGESSFTSYSKSYTNTVSSTLKMYLLALNSNGTVTQNAASGTRLYYCKIYSNSTYGTLAFDGVPCVYNGEYGLWDRVSDSFFGNAAGSGAFTGPQIS